MAKTSVVNRERKRKKLVRLYGERRKAMLKLIKNFSTDENSYNKALKSFNNLPRDAALCRRTRRCERCGRGKGVYRRFGLCRICLRNGAMRGDVPGLVKASW